MFKFLSLLISDGLKVEYICVILAKINAFFGLFISFKLQKPYDDKI